MSNHRNQQGAALVVGLILLVVVTVLAISGMNTATTELAMARNHQNYENAFQAAETGIEVALTQEPFNPLGNTTVSYTIGSNDSVTAQIAFERTTLVPDAAFSITTGGGGISAFHFQTTSDSMSQRDPGNPSDRDSSASHTQAFYVVGPTNPTL